MFNTATRSYEMTDASGSYDWMVENFVRSEYQEWTDEEIAEYADLLIGQVIENTKYDVDESDYEEVESDLRAEKGYIVNWLIAWRDGEDDE